MTLQNVELYTCRSREPERYALFMMCVVHDVISLMSCAIGDVCCPLPQPEAITGSTRMKGGTATKVLLEVISVLAIEKLHHQTPIR